MHYVDRIRIIEIDESTNLRNANNSMIQANIELRNTSEVLGEVVEMKENLVPPTGVEPVHTVPETSALYKT
ncbi:hypothetical protein BROC_00713 [Candidatus Brocadiaceae bacterium]|nr:hypothetical protein BROC_00713 [Candidatus Brocadiaceae bacterium]